MKSSITTILFLLFCSIAIAQGPPPPMNMPTESNTILIDKIIKVTNQEQYFIEYCSEKVKTYASENKWSKEKTRQILGSVKLEHYISTIYSNYASYSVEELKTILTTMSLINDGKSNLSKMTLINPMMHNNLDLFVEGLLEGKYVITGKKVN